MRTRLTLLLGMLAIALPALPLAFVVHALGGPALPPTWPKSPPEPPLAAPVAPARWDRPARESLAMLRRATVVESRRVVAALAACETQASRGTGTRRNVRYRRCATAPLARTDGFASNNGRILLALVGSAGPTRACRARVTSLAGTVGTLGMLANGTLRTGLDAPWAEVLTASRAIRRLAADSRDAASEPGWAATCKSRPPAPAPPPLTA